MSRRQLTIFCCGPTTAKCTAMKVGTMEFKTPFSFFFSSLMMPKVKFVHGCLSSLDLVACISVQTNSLIKELSPEEEDL